MLGEAPATREAVVSVLVGAFVAAAVQRRGAGRPPVCSAWHEGSSRATC